MLRAVARPLRPLVRALIRCGVTFPVLADALRAVFIEVAAAELDRDGRARTDSRLSLLTGIHRKELRRQRLEEAPAEPEVVTLHSRLIARWLGDAAYLDADGAPLALPRTGVAPSFEALVTGVTRDVHPRSVLDDLAAGGIVALEDDRVVLRARAFLPSGSDEAKLYYFARNLHDHAAAAVANILVAPPPFFDRAVHYDGLSPAAAAALEQLARRVAEGSVLDVNRSALAIAEADEPAGARRRVIMGVYVYAEDEPDAA